MAKAKPTLEALEEKVRESRGREFIDASRTLIRRSPMRAARAAAARLDDTQPYAPGPTVGHDCAPRGEAVSPQDNTTLHEPLETVALDRARSRKLRLGAVVQLGGFGQYLRLLPMIDDPVLTPELALQIALGVLIGNERKAPSLDLPARLERFRQRCREAPARDVTAIAVCGRIVEGYSLLPKTLARSALAAVAEDSRVRGDVREGAERALAALGPA